MTTFAHPVSSSTSPGHGFASGGPIPPGVFRVGERGEELLAYGSRVPGRIVPNELVPAMSNSRARQLIAQVTINATFTLPGVIARVDPSQAASQLARYRMTVQGAANTKAG
jgi:hypothetical protein